jgi:hypothetical protein
MREEEVEEEVKNSELQHYKQRIGSADEATSGSEGAFSHESNNCKP